MFRTTYAKHHIAFENSRIGDVDSRGVQAARHPKDDLRCSPVIVSESHTARVAPEILTKIIGRWPADRQSGQGYKLRLRLNDAEQQMLKRCDQER